MIHHQKRIVLLVSMSRQPPEPVMVALVVSLIWRIMAASDPHPPPHPHHLLVTSYRCTVASYAMITSSGTYAPPRRPRRWSICDATPEPPRAGGASFAYLPHMSGICPRICMYSKST